MKTKKTELHKIIDDSYYKPLWLQLYAKNIRKNNQNNEYEG